FFNPNSLKTITALVEPSLANAPVGTPYQFMRLGYFTADESTQNGQPVFNQTVSLRDSYKPGNKK
ncbi:MAG: glutamine--tRNA ligase, partial [Bacteroidota bacterium]